MYNMEELTEMVHTLKELERSQEDLATKIDNLKNRIKSHMEESGVTELLGDDWKVTWNPYDSTRLDQSKFKALYPDLYESLCVSSTSRRFSVK